MKQSGFNLLAAALLAVPVAAQEAAVNAPLIAIPYRAPHPVIDSIIVGFQNVVRETYPDARFLIRHSGGNEAEYGNTVAAALQASPVLLAPITTPIAIIAEKEARQRTPIVFMGVTDPVGAGLAASIERPGWSTGSSDLCPFEPLLQLTRTLFPQARTLALPYNPSDQPARFGREQLQALAPELGFEVIDRQVTSASELRFNVTALAGQADVLVIAADNILMENPRLVSDAATQAGTPTVACDVVSVREGAVAGVSVNYREVGEAAGMRAVRVLRGEPAGSIPVGVLRTGEIALNLEAACRVGIEIDAELIARATIVENVDFDCATVGRIDERRAWIWLAIAGLVITILFAATVAARRERARTGG